MTESYTFDSIRPFHDEELREALVRLSSEPHFLRLIAYLYPEIPVEEYLLKLNAIQSVEEFQTQVISPYLTGVVQASSLSYQLEGIEHLSKDENYFYISNHRDIILDSALLNILLVQKGFDTTEIAIGDNLLILNWITDVVRMNKSFIVQRNQPVRQMLGVARELSAYVRHVITEKKQSIWMAQREGRSKDSDDRTQDSLLKMLNMSNPDEDVVDTLQILQVVPVSISYQYDPCDFLKARELLQKHLDPGFKKTPQDDLLHMKTGLRGYKGHIHFTIAKPINEELEALRGIENKVDRVTQAAELIDKHIHNNYKLYSGNYVAYDLLHKTDRFAANYSKQEKLRFEDYVNRQLRKLPESIEYYPFLFKAMVSMYANPLINHMVTLE